MIGWRDLANVVRLQRAKLYVTVANGEAVYVPVGASPLPDCTRYSQLYRRPWPLGRQHWWHQWQRV